MTDVPSYTLEREFAAPRDLVWRSWTDAALIARWYGPNVDTVIHRLDVEPGGLWLSEMRWGGESHYQRAEYTEVSEPHRLVCLMSNCDGDWNVAPNPMMADWPRTLLTEVEFDDLGDRTRMRLTWTPHAASEAEIACFAAAVDGMGRGWGAGMEKLAELLAELQRA